MPSHYEIKKANKKQERDIITGLITSTDFIKKIRSLYKPEYFSLQYTKLVSIWCAEYYDKYEKAPGKDIKSVFDSKKGDIIDDEVVTMIDTFLENLSESFQDEEGTYNVDYHVDKAVTFFKDSALSLLIDKIEAARYSGNMIEAEAAVANFKHIEKCGTNGINICKNVEIVTSVLHSESEDNNLFTFPGDFGKFLGPLKRTDFLAFVAPAKRKKSWFMIETMVRMFSAHLNVLYVSLEMPESEVLSRVYSRLTGGYNPEFHSEFERGKEIEVPKFDSNFEKNKIVNFDKVIKEPMTSKTVTKKIKSLDRMMRGKNLHLYCAPSGSINVKTIDLYLDVIEDQEDFVADGVIIDYADLLGPEKREKDHRNQINDTWLALRSLALKRKIFLVTGSHSNKATFKREIEEGDFSEDIRKINHVTHAVGINQDKDDEVKNLLRLAMLAKRSGKRDFFHELAVLHCLEIGNPLLDSMIVEREKD